MDLYKKVNGKQVKLTDEEVAETQALWAEQEALAAATNYAYDRRSEYPPLADQLDMLYKAMLSGEIPKATEWFNSVNNIKIKYPKPGA